MPPKYNELIPLEYQKANLRLAVVSASLVVDLRTVIGSEVRFKKSPAVASKHIHQRHERRQIMTSPRGTADSKL